MRSRKGKIIFWWAVGCLSVTVAFYIAGMCCYLSGIGMPQKPKLLDGFLATCLFALPVLFGVLAIPPNEDSE